MRAKVAANGAARTALARRARAVGVSVVAVGLGAACSDSPVGPRGRAAEAFVVAALSAPAPQIVYVSLSPGTIPGGTEARLRVARTGAAATAQLVDGGFDPVALAAAVGDTVAIDVQAAGTVLSYRVPVPRPSRPVVVRTRPPRHKRDVALNASMLVVFSEPIDPATLTADAVQLRQGDAVVAGRLELIDAAHVTAQLVPAAPLRANTDYELVVTDGVRDLDGLALEAAVTVPFTTGTSTGPASGTLQVITATSGSDPDPDGYTLGMTREGVSSSATLPSSGSVTRTLLSAGTYAVSLTGVAGNCAVVGSATREVEVVAEATAAVTFAVTCEPLPPPGVVTGTLNVTTVTTGSDADANGYALLIERAGDDTYIPSLALPSSGTATRGLLPLATYTVTLAGVASNCAVAGGTARQVDLVPLATTAQITFDLTCAPLPPPGAESSGQLAFVRDGQIHVIDSDGTGLVRLTDGPNDGPPAWSPDGRRIAFVRDKTLDGQRASSGAEVYLADADGSHVVLRAVGFQSPAWSPDGRRLAVTQRDCIYYCEMFLLSVDEDGTPPVHLASQAAAPAWSPDGRRIAFVSLSGDDGYHALHVVNADGSGVEVVVPRDPVAIHQPTWSPDGRRIAFSECRPITQTAVACDIFTVNSDGTGLVQLTTAGNVFGPAWSPDGTRIAFTVSRYSSGAWEPSVAYVAVDRGDRILIVSPGYSPAWRPVK